MLGTFGGALEARKIAVSEGRLIAKVRGEVEEEDRVLVIRRVHVTFHLRTSEPVSETVERVHRVYADRCPLYRTLKSAFAISSSCELASDDAVAT
jgi:uncharacterized OsmC-like protein